MKFIESHGCFMQIVLIIAASIILSIYQHETVINTTSKGNIQPLSSTTVEDQALVDNTSPTIVN